jgi:sulfur carrier protein ThiS
MVIEISKVFLHKKDIESSFQMDIKEACSIERLMEIIGLDHMGYAVFFVNGKEVKKDYTVGNDDRLKVLPIFGGG